MRWISRRRCPAIAGVAVAAALMMGGPAADAATIVVTSTADSVAVDGAVTLREAITSISNGASVNADVVPSGSYGASDTIAFSIPGSAVRTILVASSLPVLNRPVRIDGETQTTARGDSNPGTLGTGGTVGTTALALVPVNAPEIEIRGTSGAATGLAVGAGNVVIRNLAILGFATANIDVRQNSNAVLVENCVLGTTATAFSDPGAGIRSAGANLLVSGGGVNNGTIRHNLVGFAGGRGLDLRSATGFQIQGNEVRGNGLTDAQADGIDLSGQNSINHTINGNLITASGGFGIDILISNSALTIERNSVTGNGLGGVQTAGIGIAGPNKRVAENVIGDNAGAGVLISASNSQGNVISRNAIAGNGTIGIDLLTSADQPNTGTAPYVTLNDSSDNDQGGNGLLNFPVLVEARIISGFLQMTGYARPGSVIELFVADPDPGGFGSGATYLVTLIEQSSADLDATTGSYGPGPINGISQGSDLTNRFRFVLPLASLPVAVAAGAVLTATATSANSTSEFGGAATVIGAATLTLTGTVFDDVNYGGGSGRSLADSGGGGRPAATVELYDDAGAYVSTTATDASGRYTFANLPTAPAYSVRVVNASVTAGRAGGTTPGLIGVQTYRTDVSTRVTLPRGEAGGAVPDAADSGPKGPGSNLSDAAVEQSVTHIVLPAGVTSVSGLDFGFNFDTIVNRNDAGQGSLRQFIVNANALANTGLDQADTIVALPAGVEASIFAITGAGVLTVAPTSALPAITDAATWIDGSTQPGTVLNTATTGNNAVQRIEFDGAGAGAANGLVFADATGALVRAVVIGRFTGAGVAIAGGFGYRVEGAFIGTDALGASGRGNGGDGVVVTGGSSEGTIGGTTPPARNIIAFNARGVVIATSSTDEDTTRHTVRGNSIHSNTGLGIDLGGDGVTLNDADDADSGPNHLLNYPVLTGAMQLPGALVIEGFARPGSVIELFVTDAESGGFGEGRTWLATVVEGAANDRDSRSGTYGPIVDGVTVGTDTTNQFRFELPVVVPEGALLTATATLGSSTSEFGAARAVAFPADVSISIVAPPTVQPGATLPYTVRVTNLGPGTAMGVTAAISVPPGLTWQSTTGACTTTPPCAIGTLGSGVTVTFTASYLVAANYAGPVPIVALATAGTASPDPLLVNNTQSATTLLPSADLTITKTELAVRSVSTDPVTFRITVVNRGPDDAVDVQVLDDTPAGVTFTETRGACSTPFPCRLGTLPANAQAVIDVTYAVPFAMTEPVVNRASVMSPTPDPDPANNMASASSPRQASLSVTKSGPAAAGPSQPVTFTIAVANGGPQGVAEVLVEDPTPAGLVFVSSTGACEHAFPCVVGPLPAGQSATILATYLTPPASAGLTSFTNTVTVSSPTFDPDLDDNTATIVSQFVVEPGDDDGDGMPDVWETCVGLDPTRNDAAEDPDGDGRTNAQEFADRTHPRGFAEHYLPEGSDNAFFRAGFALFNPHPTDTAHVLFRMQPEGAPEVQACFPLPPRGTTVIDPGAPTALRAGGSAGLSFATQFEADVPLVAERAMTWSGGGVDADGALGGLSDNWYFAEGATHGGFRVYYMLQNPGLEPATVEMTFLRPAPLTPVVQTYSLAPRSRLTIFANAIPELLGMDLAAIARVTGGGSIAAARAMYRDVGGALLRAGTSNSAAPSPAREWFFAEGSVSAFFAEYLLVLNPELVPATLDVTFLSDAGAPPVVRRVTVPPSSRLTVSPATLEPALVGTSSAIRVTSINDVPVVVERSMWWPNDPAAADFWTEGHSSVGATATAPRWAFAPQFPGPDVDLFLLIANHGGDAGEVLVTVTGVTGTIASHAVPIAAQARATLRLAELFPDISGQSSVIEVVSLGTALPLVVERAVYQSDGRGAWSSGSVSLGTPRP